MQMRSVVITGATSGLGLKTAEILATDPRFQVVLACRDAERARKVAAKMTDGAPHPVLTASLELGSLASIRAFPRELARLGAFPIAGLVCNAGLQVTSGLQRTADGFERTFGVNHLGHFELVEALLPRLDEGARIAVVSSNTHDPEMKTGMPAPEYADPMELAKGMTKGRGDAEEGKVRYTTSKLCNVYFARELARRLASSEDARLRSVRVAAFDPGMMPGTGLAREYPAILRFAWSYVLPILTLTNDNVNTVTRSAKRLADVISNPSPAWETGAYISKGLRTEPSREAHDEERAKGLWRASERLVSGEAGTPP